MNHPDVTDPAQVSVSFPAVVLLWNPADQEVTVQFKPEEFKTFDFLLGVLEMAKLKLEQMKRVAMMAQMQEAARERTNGQLIANGIFGGPRRG